MEKYLYSFSKSFNDETVFTKEDRKWLEEKDREIFYSGKLNMHSYRYAINLGGRQGEKAFPVLLYYGRHLDRKSAERFGRDGKEILERRIIPTFEDSHNRLARELLETCLDAKFEWAKETADSDMEIAAIIDRKNHIMYFLKLYYGIIDVATIIEEKKICWVSPDTDFMWEIFSDGTLVESEIRKDNGTSKVFPCGSHFKISYDGKGIYRRRTAKRAAAKEAGLAETVKQKKIKNAQGRAFQRRVYDI